MPFNEGGLVTCLSSPASTDMSGNQFYAVSLAQAPVSPVPGVQMVLAAAGRNMVGILQDNPVLGQAGTIQTSGITPACISPNQTIAGGALLQVDTGGTLIVQTTGTVVAQAMETLASSPDMAIISVMIMPNNSPF